MKEENPPTPFSKGGKESLRSRSFDCFVTAITVSLLQIAGCSQYSVESHVLASVDSTSITMTDLALRLIPIPGFKEASNAAQEQTALQILETLIDDEVLYLEAQNRGIAASRLEVEHKVRQLEALLGRSFFSHYSRKHSLDRKTLQHHFQKQLSALEYLRRVQKEDKPFCHGGFEVQSSQNCIMRQDLLGTVRNNHRIIVHQDLIGLALKTILESAK